METTTFPTRVIDNAVPAAIALLLGACGGEKQVHAGWVHDRRVDLLLAK